MECTEEVKTWGGIQRVFRHASMTTHCEMEFAVFVPGIAGAEPLPALFYLSGLTCTWANVADKAGAQRFAAEHGLILVMPDTSPRGLQLPGEDDDWDFGTGAGFYVNATEAPWNENYNMFDYVTEELPALVAGELGVDGARIGVTGHSMGGHGALICALKRPDVFKSCSAFAPIAAPSRCPWGTKAFTGYLGADKTEWAKWDACELVGLSHFEGPVLVDQGQADNFLVRELRPELLQEAFTHAGKSLVLRMQPGYDHSYYFIATFMGDHVEHHSKQLQR
tara:strand:+ start:1517 stop:2353 length:837 start_codon:yes stop_codon:yes gene_type:complete